MSQRQQQPTVSKGLLSPPTPTLQDLCNQYDGQYVICRLPHTTTTWTKALVITTIPPRIQEAEWEFVLFTQEDNWRHVLKAKPKKKTSEDGSTIMVFDHIRVWTPEDNLDELNAQQSDLEVIQSAKQHDKRGRLVPGTRFDNSQTEFFTQQYEKAVASLRKSLQVILFDYVKDERKEAERLLAEGKIRKKRCNDRLRFDLQRQTRIGAIEKQLVELGGATGRWSNAEHDAFIKVWLRMRHPPRKSYGVMPVTTVLPKQQLVSTDTAVPLSSSVDTKVLTSLTESKDQAVEITTETMLVPDQSDCDSSAEHIEKKAQPEENEGIIADLWSHPQSPAVKVGTSTKDNANDKVVVDGEENNTTEQGMLSTGAAQPSVPSAKPVVSVPVLLDPPILFTISKSQRSLLLRNLPVNCPGKSLAEFDEHIDWYLQYLGLTVEKKKLMLWWEKDEDAHEKTTTCPSLGHGPGHPPRSTSPSPVAHAMQRQRSPNGDIREETLPIVRPKEKEGVGYMPFAPARGHWGNDRGQLFDAHGPSFTNKANHSSKGHGIDSTATGVGTSPIHTKKEIEKEAARKKLLLWREIKEKELQAELKAQQLLLQQEKTERLRFLQEQQRKREQIKKWRDAEVQLKDERELAERQARQFVDVVKSRATSASLKRPEDSIPWGDEWVLFTKDESWRYSVLADTIKQNHGLTLSSKGTRAHSRERSPSPVGKSTDTGVPNGTGTSNVMVSPGAPARVRVEGKGSDSDDSPLRKSGYSRGAASTYTSSSAAAAAAAADGLRWIDLFPPEVIPAAATNTMVPAVASSSSAQQLFSSKSTPKGSNSTAANAAGTTLPVVVGAGNGKPIVRPQSAHPLLREAKDKASNNNSSNSNNNINSSINNNDKTSNGSNINSSSSINNNTNKAGVAATTAGAGRSLSPSDRYKAQERLYRDASHGTSHSSTTTAKGFVHHPNVVSSSATLNLDPYGEEFISWGGGVADSTLPVTGFNHLGETVPVKPRQVHPSIFFAQHRMDLNAETTQRRIHSIEARKKQLRPRNEVLKELEANVDFSYIKRDVNRLLQPTAAAGNRSIAQPQPPPPIPPVSHKGAKKTRPKSASAASRQQTTCVVIH